MKRFDHLSSQACLVLALTPFFVFHTASSLATVTIFFDTSLAATNALPGANSDSLTSCDYVFTYSLDKWWYPTIGLGPGTPTGRPVSISWPSGLTAQTITAGPTGSLAGQVSASITIQRVDRQPFSLLSFGAKILGNTAGAGAAFEIMPQLNGNDGFLNPLTLDATGLAGNSFNYTTPTLLGFDTYSVSLWMDFALTSVVLEDASVPEPRLSLTHTVGAPLTIAWPTNLTAYSLESAAALPAAAWSPVSDPISVERASFVVRPPIGSARQFYRLRKN